MKHVRKMMFVFVLALTLCLGMSMAAFAHQLIIEPLGGTYVSFSYSDGTPCKGAKIIVQDESGETLGTSKTTKEGYYDYAEYEGTAAKLIMNDGEGHVGEYEIPAETPAITDKTPIAEDAATTDTTAAAEETTSSASGSKNMVGVVLVVVVLVAVAALFAKRTKKK